MLPWKLHTSDGTDNLIFLKILGYEKVFGVTFVLCLYTTTIVITFLL